MSQVDFIISLLAFLNSVFVWHLRVDFERVFDCVITAACGTGSTC